jgi:hypothetical protein
MIDEEIGEIQDALKTYKEQGQRAARRNEGRGQVHRTIAPFDYIRIASKRESGV